MTKKILDTTVTSNSSELDVIETKGVGKKPSKIKNKSNVEYFYRLGIFQWPVLISVLILIYLVIVIIMNVINYLVL